MSNLLNRAVAKPIVAFDNYITDIRFPHFKKIKANSTIEFSCPFTVLVGPNGSGKSSTLQALYGSPRGQSVGDFWFSTALDPIIESGDDINRFIYRYKVKGIAEQVEILKTRARRIANDKRPENPDYWEPAKPNVKDNMSTVPPYSKKYDKVMNPSGRWKPVEKNVVYIDFRAELSAFDKFFYFGEFVRSKRIQRKQDFLRKFSNTLKKHLQNSKSKFPLYWGQKKRTKSVYDLKPQEISWVNRILGKSYIAAKIVEHNLFNNDGYSIIFNENHHSYSEAVAGSGEVSVVNCVVRALNAPKNSLILLDEPEVSLHPGAQIELRNLLCEVILKNDCQVVMCTHSEHFVSKLPNNAIKLFQYDSGSQSYAIINECSPEQAFTRLGVEASKTGKKIYVEDRLAKLAVEAALKEIDEQSCKNYNVIAYPGGAKTITKDLLINFAVANNGDDSIVLLDGDENLATMRTVRRRDDISKSEYPNIDSILAEQIGFSIKSSDLPLNGGNQPNAKQAIELKLEILDKYHEKFYFFNVSTPEELIWEIALGTFPMNIDEIKSHVSSGDYKDRFKHIVHTMYDGSNGDQIYNLQEAFLNARDHNHSDWITFKTRLKEYLGLVELS